MMNGRRSSDKSERGKVKSYKLLGRFLVRHGEKVVAFVFLCIAVWVACQGFYYRPLSWQPETLQELAATTEETIKNNNHTLADENLEVFDYASYAEQIKEDIPTEPYRGKTVWKPAIHPDRLPRREFEVLAAYALRGEAIRRTDSLTSQGTVKERWQLPAFEPAAGTSNQEAPIVPNNSSLIWVNLYATIPFQQQGEIYSQSFNDAPVTQPEYIYYEWEKAETKPHETPVWQPVVVYPGAPIFLEGESQTDQSLAVHQDRLIPIRHLLNRQQNLQGQKSRDIDNVLLFSDSAVEPAKTYAYRIRLYLANPNYNIQESYVEEGVDTINPYVRSDWSFFARVYVPDRTTVRLLSVAPADNGDFPRQQVPLGITRCTILLDYYDMALGQLLPPVEKSQISCGALCNMSKEEVQRFINRVGMAGNVISAIYPDAGLSSDVCVLDLAGGKKLQKKVSRDSQGTPDLFTPSKALIMLPDGTMKVLSQ